MTMILNPPLKVGAVEVTSVNEQVRSIHLMVHITARPQDVKTMEVQAWTTSQIQNACRYLVNEGFVTEPLDSWLTHIGAILHTP